jgi:hypothetical protein
VEVNLRVPDTLATMETGEVEFVIVGDPDFSLNNQISECVGDDD